MYILINKWDQIEEDDEEVGISLLFLLHDAYLKFVYQCERALILTKICLTNKQMQNSNFCAYTFRIFLKLYHSVKTFY